MIQGENTEKKNGKYLENLFPETYLLQCMEEFTNELQLQRWMFLSECDNICNFSQ